MTTAHSVIRQDEETFETLTPICLGYARFQRSTSPGGLIFEFAEERNLFVATFVEISSVTYFHELLCDSVNYPYAKNVGFVSGLYECHGSSYLRRLQQDMYVSGQTFERHKHFVYWDDAFCWQITCGSVRLEKTENQPQQIS
jgi:hypothetical protein